MKQTLLVAIASAAIGAATATMLHEDTPLPARGAPRVDAVRLELAFEQALEQAGLGEGHRVAEKPSAERPSHAPDAALRRPAAPVEKEGAAGPSAPRMLPAPNQRELQAVLSFEKDERTRRTWMFRPERDVIAWLGAPDWANVSDGGEQWGYNLEEGGELLLQFHRGRLLRITR